MKSSLKKSDLIPVAEYLFGPQHAFVFRVCLDMPTRFNAHGVRRALETDRSDLIQFVLSDLKEAELLCEEAGIYSLPSLFRMEQAVQRISD